MKKIKRFLKENYKVFIIYIIIMVILVFPLPYYIYAPGGIVNIKKRVSIQDEYKYKGSFNLSYVTEYKGNIMTLLVSLINKNWDVLKKKDIVIEDESIKDYNKRDKLFLKEAYINATEVAYKKAHKKLSISSSYLYVVYNFKESRANLKVGDKIISINEIKIDDIEKLNEIMDKYQIGDKVNIKVLRNNKELQKSIELINLKGKTAIGVGIICIDKLKTKPKIKYHYVKDEYGSSGGLMLALSIYNSLIKKDITKGKTIVGTGTIDSKGHIGEIDGVKYKMKGAAKKNIDLFIVPKANYKEAKQIKKKYNYKFKLIGVSTFDEVIEYLD